MLCWFTLFFTIPHFLFFFFLFFFIYSKFVPFASFPASSHFILQLSECKWKLSYASVQIFEVSVQTRLDIRKNKLFNPSLFKHCIGAAVQLHYVTAVGKKQLIQEKKFLNNNTDIITLCWQILIDRKRQVFPLRENMKASEDDSGNNNVKLGFWPFAIWRWKNCHFFFF